MEKDKLFIKGFNAGYSIRKNHSLLLKRLKHQVKGNDSFLDGMYSGARQYEMEIKQRMEKNKNHHQGKQRKGQHM